MAIESKLRNLQQRELIVFDFDETIVDCNSDSWIHQLAPSGCIPDQLKYCHGQDYFKHVQSVLAYLHQLKVTRQDYEDCLSLMPPVPGIIDKLIERLAQEPEKYHMIILSDSNSFFIEVYLKSKNLQKAFHSILTNSAKWEPTTTTTTTTDAADSSIPQLLVQEYHVQDHCKLSSRNLCKGEALKNFIGKQMLDQNTVYTRINYVGDGQNDFCPSSKLGPRDRIFPRAGYPLDRLCNRLRQRVEEEAQSEGRLPEQLRASITPWTNGDDILRVILAGAEQQT